MTDSSAWAGQNSRTTDLGLRASGLVLLVLAALAIRALYHRAGPGSFPEPGVLELLFAMVGFFGASAGTTLLVLGRHIFDQVRISERWAYRRVTANRPGAAIGHQRPVLSLASGDQQEDLRARVGSHVA